MEQETCKVPLTGGNIRNNHFYLRGCVHLIPAGGLGGKNMSDAGKPFSVVFEPGDTVQTDVDGSKMILRARGAVRDFFARTGATEGDNVVVQRTGEREITVSLQPADAAWRNECLPETGRERSGVAAIE